MSAITTVFGDKTLEKDIYAGLVTSLAFHNDTHLLVGHGPFLKIYNIQTGQLLVNQHIFPANRIHRFILSPHVTRDHQERRQFAVVGSKYLTLAELVIEGEETTVRVQEHHGPFQDWILDAQWWYEPDKPITAMSLVFGHNQFAIYDLVHRTLQFSVQCQVRCILYSARIYGHSQRDLIVASGTVFNQVHLWRPHVQDEQGDAIVYRQLLGHEGVIFGIRFNQDATQLVSVSDDRTIRVWSLSDEKSTALVLFGHTARIWDCQFVGDYLVSNSEDATCRVWNNGMEEDRGECVACWEGHASKNVWSCAIDPAQTVVATGGQDSGVRLWSLHAIKNNKIDSEDDLVAFPLVDTKDNIRNFVMTKDRYLIAATTEGYLLKCHADKPGWKQIQHDASYRNYAIMKSSACGRVVVVGNIVGDLVILSPTDQFEPFKVAAHKQKLFEIFIEPSLEHQDVLYIISNGYNDSVLFHQLDLSTLDKPMLHTQFHLEMPTERTTVMSLGYAEDKRILVCGSRESALLIYRLPSPAPTITPLKPTLQLRKSHGKQAVTGVLIKPVVSPDHLVFWTTGRDGCYIQYRLGLSTLTTQVAESTQLGVASQGDIVLSGQDMVLEQVYRNRVTKGTLEGALWVDHQLLLMGFFKKSFFVYNEANHFVAVAIHCGGGHRRWGFHTDNVKLHQASFAFIRKEVLYAYLRHDDHDETSKHNFYDSILQSNYHGREVRALRFFRLHSKLFFATGGEDTLLRIQQYTPQGPQLHVSIRKHTTVIKSLDVSQGQALLLFTSGGLEEFKCWKMEELDGTVHCLELASCPALTEDMESRIMDTSVFALDGGLHIIGAVYSDAMIRIWLFNEQTRQFSLLADGTWHAKCILQISHVRQGDQVYFFTSATDGQVAIWDIGQPIHLALQEIEQLETQPTLAAFKLLTPDFYYRVHMSGVNALETVFSPDKTKVWIMTGGEDNAVSIAEVDLDQMCLVNKPWIAPHAHASSVTGIKWINNTLWTTSTDQRLNQWCLSENQSHVALELKSAIYMDVPDPSALDAILFNDHVHVAITGVGLQSVRYSPSS
ncbi:WD40-repeat-containing domain protein [Blakeslea trispora]|nr:WD40-repeat-containing domain protein [Blakeslea trispora]